MGNCFKAGESRMIYCIPASPETQHIEEQIKKNDNYSINKAGFTVKNNFTKADFCNFMYLSVITFILHLSTCL